MRLRLKRIIQTVPFLVILVYIFATQLRDQGTISSEDEVGEEAKAEAKWTPRVITRRVDLRQLKYTNTSKQFQFDRKFLDSLHIPPTEFVDIRDDQILSSFEFAMGISDNHANEVHALSSIARLFPDKVVYVYDLGLSKVNAAKISSYCHVQLRKFNFTAYPDHVRNLSTYAFKPLIIQAMLLEFSGVFWVDTSVSFIKHNLTDWFRIVRSTGGHMIFCSAGHSVFAATHPLTYPYFDLSNDTAKRISTVQASGQLLYRTYSTYKDYVLWYVLCALDPHCMSPSGSKTGCAFKGDSWNKYADCHRFDQSVASIVLYGISGEDQEKHCIPGGYVNVFRTVSRDDIDEICHSRQTVSYESIPRDLSDLQVKEGTKTRPFVATRGLALLLLMLILLSAMYFVATSCRKSLLTFKHKTLV